MAPQDQPLEWTVVVPVRDPRTGKSRLQAGAAVNAAIAHDTLIAAAACPAVHRIILVTDRADWLSAQLAADPKLRIVRQHAGGLSGGLAGAVGLGLEEAGDGAVAVMLGDLPSLDPQALADALRAAESIPLGMVSDHCDTGTTLITARRAGEHRPSFGPGSAALHRGLGYAELPVSEDSNLRQDVDTPGDLDRARLNGLGALTRLALERSEVLAS